MNENVEVGDEVLTSRRRRLWVVGCSIVLAFIICIGSVFWAFNPFEDAAPTDVPQRTVPAPDTETEPDPESLMPTTPAVSAAQGRIAFVSGEGTLSTISADGEERRALGQDDPMSFLFPAWSPDGERIAALGTGDAGAGVYVFADEEDASARELYISRTGAPIYLYWQPDGSAVSFIASAEAGLDLFLSPSNGEGDARLLFEGQPLYWDWLDGNRSIVHTGPPGTDGRLAVIDVRDSAGSERLDLADPGFFQAPGVSVGGQYVAFAELDDTQRWLTIRNVETGDSFRTMHEGAVAVGWSPVDQRLAFISPQQSARGVADVYYGPLILLDAVSEEARMLTDQRVLAFFWAPDGQSIAYFTLAQGMGEQVADGPEGQTFAHFSGKAQAQHDDVRLTLSLVSVEGGDPQHIVDFRPTELFLTQFLPFFDQYALSHRLWAPDSSALIIPIVEEGEARLYIVPASGRDLRPLVDGEIGFWSP